MKKFYFMSSSGMLIQSPCIPFPAAPILVTEALVPKG